MNIHINQRFHRAWMKFVDKFTRDIQSLVEIVIDFSSFHHLPGKMTKEIYFINVFQMHLYYNQLKEQK